MKIRLTQTLFFIVLLFLPVWFCGNVAAPQQIDNQQITKLQHRSSILEKQLKKHLQTDPKTDLEERKRRRERLTSGVILTILGLAALYVLQGSIWLTIIGVGIGLALNWRKKFPRRYYTYNYNNVENNYDVKNRDFYSPANKRTRQSLWQILVGVLSTVLFVAAIGNEIGATLGIILFLSALVFLILGIVNAFRAVANKEPLRRWAMIPVGILLGLLSLGGFGGC